LPGRAIAGRSLRAYVCSPPVSLASGELPIFAKPLRLSEFVATLALAQDNAFGQPLESQLRSCLLASWLCEAAGFAPAIGETAYWVALLRYLGCTGHAHEVATVFGDEIPIRAASLVHDAANPAEVRRDVIAFATAGMSEAEAAQITQFIAAHAREWAVMNFTSGYEVADMLLQRVDFGPEVREALRFTFERWNGAGYPNHVGGEAIPLPMRVVHLSHDMEAIGRIFSPERAIEAARDRRDRTYDPALADLFVKHGSDWFARLASIEPWDAVIALEPRPHRALEGERLDDALLMAADFIDLKSPYAAGHSRRCADLVSRAAQVLGFSDDVITALRRAALVHDFGSTALPNSIWDKKSALTRAEFDRVELHPMLTEQMLRRSPALATLNPVASAHHEKSDGSGYHRRMRGDAVDPSAAVLAAAEVYVGMTTERADRAAFSPEDAALELRKLVAGNVLEPRAANAVLVAAGHGVSDAPPRPRKRVKHAGGLSQREVDVLKLAARGLTTQEIAGRLFISAKTADHHIQHVYTKIGVNTRAAAALWALQNTVVA
jgi:HD-GYP domain-containing protein (c-di-GMP phosphodiesterase class II)/DNA-binding CsgD family transcriptional regulator